MSKNQIEQLEARVQELETKVAFQDDTIDQLSHEINQHQETIAKLHNQFTLLGDRFKQMTEEMQSQPQQIEHEIPPHY